MQMNQEIRASKRMLRELYELAEEASLTGGLSGGQAQAVRRYNQIIGRLETLGTLPTGMFSALPEDSSYSTLAVDAMLAAGALEETESENAGQGPDLSVLTRLAPFVSQEDLRDLISEARRSGTTISMETLSTLAPFLGQESLALLLRESMRPTPPPPPQEPTRSEPPQAPNPPETPTEAVHPISPPVAEAQPNFDQSTRKENLARLVSRLTSANLDPEEREAIMQEIDRMTQ